MATEVERESVETGATVETVDVRNWFGDLDWEASGLVRPRTVEEVVAVMRDEERYPGPVRGRGSGHSTTICGVADGGTVVDMTLMNKILETGTDTVTVEAGALLIDVQKELEQHGLQFYVNIELGNATLGSLACCATKDASMPGEFGQANSYCVGMKIVTPAGEIVEIDESDPDLLQAARSSFGLFGIVCEATFKVRPLQAMAVEHGAYKLDEFTKKLPELFDRNESIMMYILPDLDRIAVEFRKYTGPASEAPKPASHVVWRLRNFAWKTFMPGFGAATERFIPVREARYRLVNGLNRITHAVVFPNVKARHTVPGDQTIRYPKVAGGSKYTFSIWAFPEDQYAETLREYFQFAKDYHRRTGFRPNMLHVGYRIMQDQSSLFSYTYDSPVLTIDPVSTGAPGWKDFLHAYNEFCSEHGGKPLFNQSWGLTHEQVRKAFGDRIDKFEEYRRRFDPKDRLLNKYFRTLFQGS
ncbi:MAG: FAD-binding protein [Actinomycetota bacterium]